MVRGIVFDLDGTLVDTLGDIALVMNRILRDRGWPEHPVGDYRHMVGRGLLNLVRAAVPEWAASDLDALYAHALECFDALGSGSSRPYPGVIEALGRLAATGAPMAIVSNKPDEVAGRVVADLFPAVRFGLVRGNVDGVPVKPHPAGALEAAASLGLHPSECAFVGDSDVDMATALAAGMAPVGAAWGFRGEAELRGAGAVLILSSMDEVPGLVGMEL